MKKVIQRTKGFEKAFLKLQTKWRAKFIKQLELFLEDEFHPLLKTHELKGTRKGEWSFSVANDIRAIYRKEIANGKKSGPVSLSEEDLMSLPIASAGTHNTLIIFTFIDIGSHSKVY